MAIKYQVTRVALPTSTGTFDITIPGFGTPKAAKFDFTYASQNGVLEDGARFSYGFTDGTNQACSSVYVQDAQSTTTSLRNIRDDSILYGFNSASTVTDKAVFVQWITDGVRINITASGTAFDRFLTVVLIGGSDVSDVSLDVLQMTGSDVVNVGFEPTYVEAIGVLDTVLNRATGVSNAIISKGIAINDAGNTNLSAPSFDRHGQATSVSGSYISNSAAIARFYNGTLNSTATIDTFTATGFTVTRTSDTNRYVMLLSVKLAGGAKVEAEFITVPTTIQTQSLGSATSQPVFLQAFQTLNRTVNASETDIHTDGSFYCDGTNQYSNAWSSQGAIGTSNVASISSSGEMVAMINGNNTLYKATVNSFNATGAEFNFTEVSNFTREVLAIWFIDSAAQSGTTVNDSVSNSSSVSINDEVFLSSIVSEQVTNSSSIAISDSILVSPVINEQIVNSSSVSINEDIALSIEIFDSVANTSSQTFSDEINLHVSFIENTVTSASEAVTDLISLDIPVNELLTNSNSIALNETVTINQDITVLDNAVNSSSIALNSNAYLDIQVADVPVNSSSQSLDESITTDYSVNETSVNSGSIALNETVSVSLDIVVNDTISNSNSISIADALQLDFSIAETVSNSSSAALNEVITISTQNDIYVVDTISNSASVTLNPDIVFVDAVYIISKETNVISNDFKTNLKADNLLTNIKG